MSTPRVTVLMTLYNKGPFVSDAIRSVLLSTYADFELLVVDDASTDNGLERVRAFDDPRIRIIELPTNQGRGGAANQGFEAARGEFIAILDADDEMFPDRLSEQVTFLLKNPAIGACGSCAQLLGARSRVVCWPASDDEARGLLLFEDPMLYGSSMLRRSVLLEHRIRCPESWRGPGMDYLFLLRLASVTKVANLQAPLTRYRIGPNNLRHGRDPVEFTEPIVHGALEHFGITASVKEVRAHLIVLRRAPLPGSRAEVKDVSHWALRLLSLNDAHGWFTRDVFSMKISDELDHLFYRLADKSPAMAAPLLFRCVRGLGARLRYMASRLLTMRG